MSYLEMFVLIRMTLDKIQKRFHELEYRESEQNEVIQYLRNRIKKIEKERNVIKGRSEQLKKEYDEILEELKKLR